MKLYLIHMVLPIFFLMVSVGILRNDSKEYDAAVKEGAVIRSAVSACCNFLMGDVIQEEKEYISGGLVNVSKDNGIGYCNQYCKVRCTHDMIASERAEDFQNGCFMRLLSERYRDGFYFYSLGKLIL